MIFRPSLKLGHVRSKLGHLVKFKENLVNSLELLVISRPSLKLGHFKSITRSLGQV